MKTNERTIKQAERYVLVSLNDGRILEKFSTTKNVNEYPTSSQICMVFGYTSDSVEIVPTKSFPCMGVCGFTNIDEFIDLY